jgi:hypothetical protein
MASHNRIVTASLFIHHRHNCDAREEWHQCYCHQHHIILTTISVAATTTTVTDRIPLQYFITHYGINITLTFANLNDLLHPNYTQWTN